MAHKHSTPANAPAQASISRDFTQISARNCKVRRLTVVEGPRTVREPDGRYRSLSSIRFGGRWLEAAGFPVGTRIAVHVEERRLVLEVMEAREVDRGDGSR